MLAVIAVFLFSGCTAVNRDHDVLLTEPYSKVVYVADPTAEGYRTVDIIQLTTRGYQATILNTIPRIYLKAQERAGRQDVVLGNIRITSFTKEEEHEIPVRRCRYVPLVMRRSYSLCFSSSCDSRGKPRIVYREKCFTEFRIEKREILCQKATVDILSKQENK
jgi:hypothetical protein